MRRLEGSYDFADKPVLVVLVDQMYLVDDLRSRDGDYVTWKALLFDANGKVLVEYGAGS